MMAIAAAALANIGTISQIGGMVSGAISSYYNAKTAQYQVQAEQNALKSKSLSIQYQADVSEINANAAEFQAMLIMRDRRKAIAQLTMQAGQVKSAARTSIASRGVQLDVGSTAEIMESLDFIKEADMLTINSNYVRAAENAKVQAANERASALISKASAGNVLASMPVYSGGSPLGAAFGSILGGVGNVASSVQSNPALMSKIDGWFK